MFPISILSFLMSCTSVEYTQRGYKLKHSSVAAPAPVVQTKQQVKKTQPTKFAFPKFRSVGTNKNINTLTNGIIKDVLGMKSDFNTAVCSNPIAKPGLEQKYTLMQKLADNSTGKLASLYFQNISVLKQLHPEFKTFLKILNTNKTNGLEDYETGVLWGLTGSLFNTMCTQNSSSVIASEVIGMIHLISSKEALYDTVFQSFATEQIVDNNDIYWLRHTSMMSVLNTQIKSLLPNLQAREDQGIVTNNEVTITGSLPLSCKPEIEVLGHLSPNMNAPGSNITKDAQFFLKFECENTSKTKRLMSESITKTGTTNGCLFDPTKEIVLPELEPGQKSAITMGPYLITEDCSDNLSLLYNVKSSHFSGTSELRLNLTLTQPTIRINAPSIEQDAPGFSDYSTLKGISEGSNIELNISATAPSGYDLFMKKITPYPVSPFVNNDTLNAFVKFLRTGNKRTLYDDIDLQVKKREDWKGFFDSRKKYASKRGFNLDTKNVWFQTDFLVVESCQSSSSYLESPVNNLYKSICEDLQYSKFYKWMTDLHVESCKAKQLSKKLMDLKGNASGSSSLFLDPGYDDVVKATQLLIQYNMISAGELSTALSFIDTMKYYGEKPTAVSFSREEGRQLILAAKILELLLDAFGPEDIKPLRIFQDGAAISIIELEEELLKIQLKKALQLQKDNLLGSSSTQVLLRSSLNHLMKKSQCTKNIDLPKSLPREIRNTTKYFRLPLHQK